MNNNNDLITNISRNRLLTIAGTGWLFDAMDVGLLSFLMAALAVEWQLSPAEIGTIASVNSIGMAIGAFVFGVYADKKGRKAAFMITLILFSLGSGLSAFAWGLTSLLVLRFIIGMGLGGELPVASTLVSESVPANIRGKIIVILESFWAVGWLLSAVIAYFIMPYIGWRGVLLLCVLPTFYAFYLRRNLPDATIYQQKQAQVQQHSIGAKLVALWRPEFRNMTIMLWILWFIVVFSYYGMFLWLPSVMMMKGFSMISSFGYVLLMTLAQLPGYASVALLIDRIGRKKVLVIYLLGTVFSAYMFGQADSLYALCSYGALLSFFNLGVWGALYAYTAEQYNTEFRGTGAGMAAAVGRIGGIFGPIVVGFMKTNNYQIESIFLLFSISILIAILAIIVLGEESNSKELN